MGRKAEKRVVERLRAPSESQIPENPVTTGQKIKFYRVRAGFTQDVLAGHLGVSAGLVKHWESDEEPGPRLEQLKAMAKLFSHHLDGVAILSPIVVGDLIGDDPEEALRGFTSSDLEEFIRVQRVYVAYTRTQADPGIVHGVEAALEWAEDRYAAGEFDEGE